MEFVPSLNAFFRYKGADVEELIEVKVLGNIAFPGIYQVYRKSSLKELLKKVGPLNEGYSLKKTDKQKIFLKSPKTINMLEYSEYVYRNKERGRLNERK